MQKLKKTEWENLGERLFRPLALKFIFEIYINYFMTSEAPHQIIS